MELFLAKLLGVYLIIMGAMVLVRRRTFMPTVKEMIANRPVLMAVALIELAAGLAIVLAYPMVSIEPVGIISLVGWMMLVEGVVYLGLPAKTVQKFVAHFNTKNWYIVSGLVAIAGGLYLARFGFGMM